MSFARIKTKFTDSDSLVIGKNSAFILKKTI